MQGNVRDKESRGGNGGREKKGININYSCPSLHNLSSPLHTAHILFTCTISSRRRSRDAVTRSLSLVSVPFEP